MDLEEALAKVVELGREEQSIVRKRGRGADPGPGRCGHDYNEMRRAADEADHHAHILR